MLSVDLLKVVPFGDHPPVFNMAVDARLMELCENDCRTAFLRFYTWRPAALSLGYLESESTIDAARAAQCGVEVVRRPTGGRVVLHDQDLTYTVAVPREGSSEALYIRISECILAGLSSLGASVQLAEGSPSRPASPGRPCFLSAARHEIVSSGRKIVGSAQRIGRRAALQHGTIPIGKGYLRVVEFLACADSEKEEMRARMVSRTTCLAEVLGSSVDASKVAAALLDAFAARFAVDMVPVSPDAFYMERSQPGAAALHPE